MNKKILGYAITTLILLYVGTAIIIITVLIEESSKTECEKPNINCDIDFHIQKMNQILGLNYTNKWGGYFETYPDLMHRITLIPKRLVDMTTRQSFMIMRFAYLITILALSGIIVRQHGGKIIHVLITVLILIQTGLIGLTLAGVLARTGITILLLTILITKKQSTRNLLLLIMTLTHHYGVIIAIATYIVTRLTKKNKYEPHIISALIIVSHFIGKITGSYMLIQSYMLATIMLGLLIGLIITKITKNNNSVKTS